MRKISHDIDHLLATLKVSLDSGDLNGAYRAYQKLDGPDNAGQSKLTKNQTRELVLARRRLHELRNWQHWANNKRRQRLCKKVESLADAELHPDALLQTLHDAQSEWKRLDQQEKLSAEKRGAPASGRGLERRFRRVCNHAFNHVRPFLEKRSEVRDQNLKAVEVLASDLEKMTDAERNLDIAKATHELRQARQVLSRLSDLPPRKRGRIAKRLRSAMVTLQTRIKQHNGAIAEQKRALIRDAEALNGAQDLSQALSTAKQLNRRWKKAGQLPRGLEQKLWKALRRHLDPLFEQEAEAEKKDQAARAEKRDRWLQLCKEAENLASKQASEAQDAEARFKQLCSEWRTAGVRDRKLNARFNRAQTAFRQRLDDYCVELRFDQIRSRFEAALKQSPPTNATTKANGQAQETAHSELLCLKLEMMAGVESPPEAQAARMNLKVQQLNQVLRGERENNNDEREFEALLNEWCETATKTSTPSMQARVKHSIEAFYDQRL